MSYTCDRCGKEFETPILVESGGEYGGIAHKEDASPCCQSDYEKSDEFTCDDCGETLPIKEKCDSEYDICHNCLDENYENKTGYCSISCRISGICDESC